MDRIDWNKAWKERNARFRHDHSAAYWDDRAPSFRKHRESESGDEYVEQFYAYCGFAPGETIFDMGCASGTLAIPYALKGHEVWCADFSERMLDCLVREAKESGVSGRIHPVLLDWNEDWTLRKDLPLCDVAICSRAFVVEDLAEAILKLESVANDRCCIGTWDKPTTHYDRGAAKAIGYDSPDYGSYVYVLGELINLARLPELRFIRYDSDGRKYESEESLRKSVRESFQHGLSKEQERLLGDYISSRLTAAEKNGALYYRLAQSEPCVMAHIRWEVPRESRR